MNDIAGTIAAGLSRQAPDLSATTLELTKRLARLQTVVEAATATTLNRHGLSRGEYDVLSTLRSTGAPFQLKPGELTQRLLFTTGGTANLLRSLAARGYLVKTADPHDGRSSWVSLTDNGAAVALAVVRDAVAVQTRLLGQTRAGTLQSLISGLAEVLDTLDSASDGARR
jgi:DNA-binding MarR family transcriptional regulator